MSSIVINELRILYASICDKVKEMALRGDCDHLTDEDISHLIDSAIPKGFISVKDACNHLGISKNKFYEYRKAGLIPNPVKIKGVNNNIYSRKGIEDAKERISSLAPKELKELIKNKNKSRGSKYIN